jgi:SAM-dependent methyltransferase
MSIFSRFSSVSRRRKLQLFNELMRPTAQMRVLDVGAEIGPDPGAGVHLIDVYPWKHNISAVNTSPEHIQHIKDRYPDVDARVADACRLPWEDKHFDIVCSNAVIEHVGSFDDQRQMAREIMRVGRRWFVTTPNRWYPFEFHMRLPFVTWLPFHGYIWFSRLVSYSHVRRTYVFGAPVTDTRLLSASGLRRCFPGSRIVKHRVTFMAETLIAIGPEEQDA